MLAARNLMLTVATALLLAAGGCVTTRGSVASSTLDLQRSAEQLADDAANVPPPPDADYAVSPNYARDAHALAASARELRHTVEDGGTDSDVRLAFNRVSRDYHAVRDEVRDSGSLQVRHDFRSVNDSYRDVAHDLGAYRGEGEYAPEPPPAS